MIQTVLIMKPALRDIVRTLVNIRVILADRMQIAQQFFTDQFVNVELAGLEIPTDSAINVSL